MKEGDTVDATIQKSNGAAYFTIHCLIRNECVVYPDNYEIVEAVAEPDPPVDADKMALQAYINGVVFG